jgi:hypothetical protein
MSSSKARERQHAVAIAVATTTTKKNHNGAWKKKYHMPHVIDMLIIIVIPV